MDYLTEASKGYVRSNDALLLAKPIKHGDRILQPGEVLPAADFTDERLGQLIRTRIVTIMPGGVSVGMVKVTPLQTGPVDFKCEVCGRAFKSKTFLGSHRRVHRKKE